MYMQIRLPLICFLIVLFCFWHFTRKKRLPTKASRVFSFMVVVSIIHLAASTITEYTVNNRATVPETFNYVWHIIYLVSLTGFCSLIVYYLTLIIERTTGKELMALKISTGVICVVGIIAQIFLPIDYVDTPGGSYSLGPKAFSLYIVVAYMLAMLIYNSIRYRRYLGAEKSEALLVTTIIYIITGFIQMYQPHILLTGPAITLLILSLIIGVENNNLYIDYKSLLFNEKACLEMILEKLRNRAPFKIGIYVFTGEDLAIEKIMTNLEHDISHSDLNLVCGTMADNLLIVMPPFVWFGTAAMPEELPQPRLENTYVRCRSEILDFSGEETFEDVEHIIRNRKIKYEAEDLRLDELTRLLRRETFIFQVNSLIDRGVPFSFIMVDLDNFKNINDSYGHNIGDIVLRSTADIFRSVVRSSDMVCRIGGDEFSLVLNGVTDKETIMMIMGRIMKKLEELTILPDSKHKIRLSAGVRVYTPDPERIVNFQTLYTEADSALYDIKKGGKNGLSFYDENKDE